MDKSNPSKQVLEFLEKENKPLSVKDIFESLEKEFEKASIQRALDSLLFLEKIREKPIGNNKIYFCSQADCDPKEIKAELQMLAQKKSLLESALKTKQERIRELQTKLKSFSTMSSIDELEMTRNQLLGSIEMKTEKIEAIKTKSEKGVPADDLKLLEKKHVNVLSAYRKRKRICADMMDDIMEGYPKSKKQLIEDIGLETDEAAGFSLPK